MVQIVFKWLKDTYRKTITSIAFLPAIIALLFLLVSFLMISLDFSETGKNIKSNVHWLTLKDATTARTIISMIAGGIISLTVFSFSMVMIVLNQTASQMSNRILDKLIGNRFQQSVLGFYIGTIVYALFLLSTIRDINSGIYVPAISTYLLIALTIADIFLFIYFLHYITESVKFETIIHKIYDNTRGALERSCQFEDMPVQVMVETGEVTLNAFKSGLYQGFDTENLISVCEKEEVTIFFFYPVGTFLIEGRPMLVVGSKKDLPIDFADKLISHINIHRGQDINSSYYYGFKQLAEVAIRALSPGINDPGTAIISLQALSDLLAYRLEHFPETHFRDKNGTVRIVTKEKSFEEIFEESILPIWDYGKADRLIQNEMIRILTQLQFPQKMKIIDSLLDSIRVKKGDNLLRN